MIDPGLLSRLRSLTEAYRIPIPASAERRDELQPVTPTTPVRQITAQVEALLADGRYRVLAAGQQFDVDLPPSTRVGERVQITLPGTRATPEETGPSVRAQVSTAGRFVAELVADRQPGERRPGAIVAPQPLLPDAPVDPRVAAATLRELVALSGLFYESHQAEWVDGRRQAGELQREPQGKLPAGGAANRTGEPAAAIPRPIAIETAFTGERMVTRVEGQALPAPVHPEAAPLVQQQLNTLEARHILWNGQIWQGQPMHWEIEETEDHESGQQEPARIWQTRIDLCLPNLGEITALLTFGTQGVAVRLRAKSDATDALFAQRLGELHESLTHSGLAVAGISREHHDGR